MLIWYGAGAVAAITIAWLAALVHASGHAPVGLVPLAVGAALGATLSKIAAMLHVAGRRRLIFGTILLAILAILAEHTWLYLDFRRQWRESRARNPQVAMFRSEEPLSPAEYFDHEWSVETAAIWSLDGAVITAGTVGTMLLLRRERN